MYVNTWVRHNETSRWHKKTKRVTEKENWCDFVMGTSKSFVLTYIFEIKSVLTVVILAVHLLYILFSKKFVYNWKTQSIFNFSSSSFLVFHKTLAKNILLQTFRISSEGKHTWLKVFYWMDIAFSPTARKSQGLFSMIHFPSTFQFFY